MNLCKIAACTILSLPGMALAQVSHSRAVIVPDVVPETIVAAPLPDVCYEQRQAIADRRALLQRDKLATDDQGAALDREAARLADELRHLDSYDTAAVADYNARSMDHNRRVAGHNRQVGDVNAAISRVNADSVDVSRECGPY